MLRTASLRSTIRSRQRTKICTKLMALGTLISITSRSMWIKLQGCWSTFSRGNRCRIQLRNSLCMASETVLFSVPKQTFELPHRTAASSAMRSSIHAQMLRAARMSVMRAPGAAFEHHRKRRLRAVSARSDDEHTEECGNAENDLFENIAANFLRCIECPSKDQSFPFLLRYSAVHAAPVSAQ